METLQTEQPVSTHANDYLNQYNCTDGYTGYLLGIKLTTGARAMAEANEAFWLLDVICSHQLSRKVRGEGFQVWKFIKTKGDAAKVVCEDGNDNIVVTQKITYTDFPFQTATLWLVGGVIMLPSEY